MTIQKNYSQICSWFYNTSMKHRISIVFDTKPSACRKTFQSLKHVLVPFIYVRIFDTTTPVSNYLQTPGLDVLEALRMIYEATDKLSKVARDFAAIYQHATTLTIQHLIMRCKVLKRILRCIVIMLSWIKWSSPSAADSLSIKIYITTLRALILSGLRK